MDTAAFFILVVNFLPLLAFHVLSMVQYLWKNFEQSYFIFVSTIPT
jgi:hypothetical protein